MRWSLAQAVVEQLNQTSWEKIGLKHFVDDILSSKLLSCPPESHTS
jgi:hypothetical protein